MKRAMAMLILGAALSAPAAAGTSEDDLAAVKRAVLASNVSSSQAPRPLPEDPGQAARETRPETRGKREAVWFRVRVNDKHGRGGRVSINLPLGLVRLMGEDWPIPTGQCRKRDRCGIKLGELLRAFDAGQSLVEIEDADASVRVWIE